MISNLCTRILEVLTTELIFNTKYTWKHCAHCYMNWNSRPLTFSETNYMKKNVTFQSHVHVFEEINLWSLYCNLSAYLIDTIKSVQSLSDKEITYIDKCYNSYCIKFFFLHKKWRGAFKRIAREANCTKISSLWN